MKHEPMYLIINVTDGSERFVYENEKYWDFTSRKHFAKRFNMRDAGEMVSQVLASYPLAVLRIEHV